MLRNFVHAGSLEVPDDSSLRTADSGSFKRRFKHLTISAPPANKLDEVVKVIREKYVADYEIYWRNKTLEQLKLSSDGPEEATKMLFELFSIAADTELASTNPGSRSPNGSEADDVDAGYSDFEDAEIANAKGIVAIASGNLSWQGEVERTPFLWYHPMTCVTLSSLWTPAPIMTSIIRNVHSSFETTFAKGSTTSL